MNMYIWLCKDTGAMNRPLRLAECSQPISWVNATLLTNRQQRYGNPSAALSQTVSSITAIRQQHYRRPLAAVGVRFIVPTYTYSQQHCTPFEMPSRNVRNVFILCMLHIRHAKVWFLRHKSMVFGVQKPPFYIAKTPFLKYQNGVLNLEHIRQY